MSDPERGSPREVVATGPTVEEATRAAVERPESSRGQAVNEPIPPAGGDAESVGPAPVRMREEGKELPSPDGAVRSAITEILSGILERMGLPAPVKVRQESPADVLVAEICGEVPGLLIGRHGQTLGAIEYVLNRALAQCFGACPYVHVDAGGYRERRRAALRRMAERARALVKRRRRPMTLEPMSSRDRREIHLALADDEWVTTESVGEGEERRVRVVPRSGARSR